MTPVPLARARYKALFLAIFFAFSVQGCSDDDDVVQPPTETDLRVQFALQTLPPIPYPPDNAPRQERIALGRLLFFDPILSGEMDVACGTCHHPEFAFADRRQFGAGTSGSGLGPNRILSTSSVTGNPITTAPRNTPTIFNTAYNIDENGEMSYLGQQFWDGRALGLEVQSTLPISSRVEMRGDAIPFPDREAAALALDTCLVRLQNIPEYVTRFRDAFPLESEEYDNGERDTVIDSSTYVRAMASYERELVTRDSPYDRYVMGDDSALSDYQKQGLELFFTKAKCSDCHGGPLFTDFSYVVQGVPQEGDGKAIIPGDDTGREEHTKDPNDRYAFRTPTLRNVELTPPFMHDGVFGSLEEVVAFYNDGAHPRHPEVTDEMLHESLRVPLGLTDEEAFALVEFMKALTDPGNKLDPMLTTVPSVVPSGLMPVFGLRGVGSGRP